MAQMAANSLRVKVVIPRASLLNPPSAAVQRLASLSRTATHAGGSLFVAPKVRLCDFGGVWRAQYSNGAASVGEGEREPFREPIRTLILDNYDSYTYNLFQLLSVINGGSFPQLQVPLNSY